MSSRPELCSLRRGESPTWNTLQHLSHTLGARAALVEFYLLEDRIATFVMQEGWDTPRILSLPISRQELFDRYFLPYKEEMFGREDRNHDWLSLGDFLLAPLLSSLSDIQLVYFVPHGWFHRLPLHALTIEGEPFIAHYAVAYAPSAAVLLRTLESTLPEQSQGTAFILGYTHKVQEEALFLGEAREIAKFFDCQPILGQKATKKNLQQQALTAHHLHLSCHGKFNQDNPLDSAVQLADGAFTARDWMSLQLQADLVTLSACETGFSAIGGGDETVGLTRALLYAGASSVLLPLWSVNAETTLEWMQDFYRRTWDKVQGKQQPEAFAFQEATLALRERYPDPYYWAPFILVGDWR